MYLLLPEKAKRYLSRMNGKLSCTVLRRGKGSNPFFSTIKTELIYHNKFQTENRPKEIFSSILKFIIIESDFIQPWIIKVPKTTKSERKTSKSMCLI